MEPPTFNIINDITQPKDIFSNFEETNVLSIKNPNAISLHDFNLYRGSDYLGMSLNMSLMLFDTTCQHHGFFTIDDEIQMVTNTIDGHFLLILTKIGIMYLIFTKSNRVVFKKDIKSAYGEEVKNAVIVQLDDLLSEIWLFLNSSVIIYRKANFCKLEEIILGNNIEKKAEILSEIKVNEVNFPFLRAEPLILTQAIRSAKGDRFFISILYSNYLLVLCGHHEQKKSCIDVTYETNLSYFDISLKNGNKLSMSISSDETHVLFLDDHGAIWICNFLMDTVVKRFESKIGTFNAFVASPSQLIICTKCSDDVSNLDILSYPTLKRIENIEISSSSILYPVSDDSDPIFVLDCSDINLLTLKCIRRLDTNVRLQEIIESNNFEYAYQFADLFNLDKEPIYIRQLKFIVKLSENKLQPLACIHYEDLYNCMKEIKSFFDVSVFEQLLLISMPSILWHDFILQKILFQSNAVSHTEEGTNLIKKLESEISQFRIFGLFIRKSNYSMNDWPKFRQKNEVEIFYSTVTMDDFQLLPLLWPMIENNVDEIFQPNDQLCQSLTNLSMTLISQRSEVSRIHTMLSWIATYLFKKQISVCPEGLRHLTNMFEEVLIEMEATYDKSHRSLCIDILHTACLKLDIKSETMTPILTASVEVAGLLCSLETTNPACQMMRLRADMLELNALFETYKLDLNTKLLRKESKSSLASRILDQMSTNELMNDNSLPLIKEFLKRYNLRKNDFFYYYLEKLISTASLGTFVDIEQRFIILMNNITEMQLRLVCLEMYASKAEFPFTSKLKSLIELEISKNSLNNPVIRNLKLLLRKSSMTPKLSKYGISYDDVAQYKPERLLAHILHHIEASPPSDILSADLRHVVAEYNLDDLDVSKVRCKVYTDNIFSGDETLSTESFLKLKAILNFPNYPNSTKKVLQKHTFQHFITRLSYNYHMSYSSLSFVLDVGQLLSSKIHNYENQWEDVFKVLKFSLSLRCNASDQSIFLPDLIGEENDISSLLLEERRLDIIKTDIYHKVKEAINRVSQLDNFTHINVKKEVSNDILDIVNFCLTNAIKKSSFFAEIFQKSFHKVINTYVEDNQYLACCAIYTHLSLVYSFGLHDSIYCQPSLIQKVLLCLQKLDLLDHVYLLWDILGELSKILQLYIYHEIQYLYKNYAIVLNVVNFLRSLLRGYAELDSPSNFEVMHVAFRFHEMPTSLTSFHKFIRLIKYGIAVVSSLHCDDFQTNINTFNVEILNVIPDFCEHGLFISGYLAALNVATITVSDEILPELRKQFNGDPMKKILLSSIDAVFKAPKVDPPYAMGLMLLLSRELLNEQLRTIVGYCGTFNKMHVFCTIAFILYLNGKIFENKDKKMSPAYIYEETKKFFWGKTLIPYKITMFKVADEAHIVTKRLELLQNKNIPLNMVIEFLKDFDRQSENYLFEMFKDLFNVSFSDCNTIDTYKIKVESILERAEDVWNSIPNDEKVRNTVTQYCHQVLDYISPYHYEILEFLFDRLHSVTYDYEHEIKIIQLLFNWKRCSPPGDTERLNCASMFSSSNIVEANYLVTTRLPYNLINLSSNPMEVMEAELQHKNANLWLNMYQALNKSRPLKKTNINTDILKLRSVENVFSDFILHCKVPNDNLETELVFFGDLYPIIDKWFSELLIISMDFLNNLITNTSFIEVMTSMMKRLWIAEQRMRLIDISLDWVDHRLSFSFCLSKDRLMEWRSELIAMKHRLIIEDILFKTNVCDPEYLKYTNDCSILSEFMLHNASALENISSTQRNEFMSALMKISQCDIDSIDINNLSHDAVVTFLKSSSSHNHLHGNDHEMSILNMSVDSSTSDFEQMSVEVSRDVETKRLELLISDTSVRAYIMKHIIDDIIKGSFDLISWRLICIFLFRCLRDEDDPVISSLCNHRLYSALLTMISAGPRDYQEYSFEQLRALLGDDATSLMVAKVTDQAEL